ncbi:Pectic enzymes secretion protein outO [Serratia rubidaea]|uniref:Pectic enzymes secretion protein outO n=1 Tax=Serratia rubidaea TaxID=61652 RepID=A0A4U9HF53_SERRU|nr:Pectic enzymes secretion protein outO [Serratia rubidaea]
MQPERLVCAAGSGGYRRRCRLCRLWALFWLFRLGSGKEALGYGDFKLTAALGAWCGWQSLPNLLLLAAGGGLTYVLLRRGWNKEGGQEPLAFGPWLAISGVVNLLFLVAPINY